MAKKLLNVTFASTNGTYSFNLGADSPGGLPEATYPLVFHRSDDVPMQQTGALIYYQGNLNAQVALYDAFTKAGYDSRVGCLHGLGQVDVKMYLNGAAVIDGEPMPYIKWEPIFNNLYQLNYYSADGTYIDELIYNGNGALCGKLYDDGTFTGDVVDQIKPHTIGGLGVYSHKIYEWIYPVMHYENNPIISSAVINSLKDYLPIEPEGQFVPTGNGDFDASSDPIDFPDLPTLNVLDTGLIQIYEMTSPQLRALSSFLWSNLFDLDTFKKMFNDPMEAILNLSIMPVDISDGITSAIRIGNITTSVSGQKCANQYKVIDFGTINMNEYWATYADYSPFTKLSIYLPYVGIQQISIDDVMNGKIQLKAYCDLLTGSVQYVLKSKQGNPAGHGHDSVLYTWGGNCQYQVPLSASNMQNVISSITSTVGTIAGGVGMAVATGGMTAPIAAGMAGSAIANVMSAKTHVQRGGGIGGAVGMFGVQKPYLILERPEQVTSDNYEYTMGVPNEQASVLKYCSGYVKVKGVHLNITGATENELNMIEALLKEGVIV